MRKLWAVLALLAAVALSYPASMLVLPWADDLDWGSDTLLVLETETAAALPVGDTLGIGVYYLRIRNPNDAALRLRFDTEADPPTTHLDSNQVEEYFLPWCVGEVKDSVFITAEDSCTVFLEYYIR